jgi:hypothetical protein
MLSGRQLFNAAFFLISDLEEAYSWLSGAFDLLLIDDFNDINNIMLFDVVS